MYGKVEENEAVRMSYCELGLGGWVGGWVGGWERTVMVCLVSSSPAFLARSSNERGWMGGWVDREDMGGWVSGWVGGNGPCENVLRLLLEGFLSVHPMSVRAGGGIELPLEEIRRDAEAVFRACEVGGWVGG